MERISSIFERILASRGIVGESAIGEYLHPSLGNLAKPESMPGVAEAADAIRKAVSDRRRLVVFGDYDCDGVCATAIMVRTLSTLGAEVEAFIPRRLTEGYGMTEAALKRLLAEFPDVGMVITVDNGINSVQQVDELKRRGISVVITDHHLPGNELPAADAIVNPKVKSPPELANQCGAGVAFLLANRLVDEFRRLGLYDGASISAPLLVLAGLATVTDVMPLVGQNRILVSSALCHFRSCAPMGLKALYSRAARQTGSKLSSKDFGFMLGPRINAAGRIATGIESLELVLSDDRDITGELARIVDGYNVERKSIEQRMLDDALLKIEDGASAQVIVLPEGHPGVAGIVATRVMEKLGGAVPVCVIAAGHGSARSPEGLNIRDAFVACDELLERYGGHAAAGGFSVKPGKIAEFRQKLCAYCDGIGFRKVAAEKIEAEFWVDPADITLSLAEEVAQMEPFGEGNREPVFGFRAVRLADVRTLGIEGRHLSFAIANVPLRAVWWNHGDLLEQLHSDGASTYDLMFILVISEYGTRHVELNLVSLEKHI